MKTLAYCPYSHFRVGSALLTKDGHVFKGMYAMSIKQNFQKRFLNVVKAFWSFKTFGMFLQRLKKFCASWEWITSLGNEATAESWIRKKDVRAVF